MGIYLIRLALSAAVALAVLLLVVADAAAEAPFQVNGPREIDLGLMPRGEARTLEVPITNTSASEVVVLADVREVIGEAQPWIFFKPPRLVLAPGQTETVLVTFAFGPQYEPRRLVTVLRFYQEPAPGAPTMAIVGLNLKFQVAGVRLDVMPRDADVAEAAEAIVFVENYDAVPADLALHVALRADDGLTRPVLEAAPVRLEPNGTERFDLLVDTKGLRPGPYQIEAWAEPAPNGASGQGNLPDGKPVVARAIESLFIGTLRGEVLDAGPRLIEGDLVEYRALVRNTGNRPLAVALTGLLHDAQGHPRGEGVETATIPVGETQEMIVKLPVHRPSLSLAPTSLWGVLRGDRYTMDAAITVGNETEQRSEAILVPASGLARGGLVLGGLFLLGLAALAVAARARAGARRYA